MGKSVVLQEARNGYIVTVVDESEEEDFTYVTHSLSDAMNYLYKHIQSEPPESPISGGH